MAYSAVLDLQATEELVLRQDCYTIYYYLGSKIDSQSHGQYVLCEPEKMAVTQQAGEVEIAESIHYVAINIKMSYRRRDSNPEDA